MERFILMFCAIPVLAIAISVSSNGNSPKVKMIGGMMVDVQQDFVPMIPKPTEKPIKSNYEKSKYVNLNSTNLSINERYRRLIPYMTFYYANDLSTPTTQSYSTKEVEVEKLHLYEAPLSERAAKKLIPQIHHSIPRYQGNRLTKYNIASSNPGRIFKDNTYQLPTKSISSHNTYEYKYNNPYTGRHSQKQNAPKPDLFQRKPYVNVFPADDNTNIRYYLTDKEPAQKYKLVPYEQTPPVKIITETENIYEQYKKPSNEPFYVTKEVYVKQRPNRPQYTYDNVYVQQHQPIKKQPVAISENYYETTHPSGQNNYKVQPLIEGGFKPIISEEIVQPTDIPMYMSTATESAHTYYDTKQPIIETSSVSPEHTNSILQPNYYQYVVDQPAQQPEFVSNAVTLSDLLHSLQKTKSIPKPITRENVGSSIKTLLQVLNAMRVAAPIQNEISEAPVLSTPKPFVATPKIINIAPKPVVEQVTDDIELSQEPYLAPVTPPSQHLDDFHIGGGSTQTFPLQVNSDDEGGTPGKPGVDYPILTIIPETSFDCKTQRYKGFFADPETRCQVWHYCDLNGGQASFLCPNGTIFSQAGLTCDWWFNVRCASTTQLYVLNESLYKYILPHSPKFPEDYSGPLVDKYLTLKFKEMEEQFRKNKNKQAVEKIDSDEDEKDESSEDAPTTVAPENSLDSDEKRSVNGVNIVVENSGSSGNVERLQI